MTKKQTKIAILTFLVLLTLINLPFLPGPNFLNGPAQLFFTVGQILGMVGLLCVPIGLVWLVISRNMKSKTFRPIIFTITFLAPVISILFLTTSLRQFSRNIAIKNGNKLVRQIESYKSTNGYYPERIDNSTFALPNSWIIGIDDYNYAKTDKTLSLALIKTFY